MNVKSIDRESAVEFANAIRDLRRTAGLTQAQLAVAIGIAPTSIYRYEAGLTKPDLRTIQRLFVFADKHQDQAAKRLFQRELQHGGDLIVTGTEGTALKMKLRERTPAAALLKAGSLPLTPREQVLAVALVLLLRNNVDESAEKMIKLLLEPWMKAAKDQLDQE